MDPRDYGLSKQPLIKKPSKYERMQDMALFESGADEDDEDEDYSMNEDMLKN